MFDKKYYEEKKTQLLQRFDKKKTDYINETFKLAQNNMSEFGMIQKDIMDIDKQLKEYTDKEKPVKEKKEEKVK